jgi:hypothetical protein
LLSAHELLALERVERLLDLGARAAGHLREGAAPEHFSDDSRILDERLLVACESIEPGRDDSLHRLRQVVEPASLPDQASELLGVEGVARARSSTASRRDAGITARSTRFATRRPASTSDRGDSEMVTAFGLPPPQPGRRDSSSGRLVATISIGTPVAESTR